MGAPSRPSLVLLAAGRSSRMGEPKGLVAYRGRPWIASQLDAVAASGVIAGVIVVLGHDADRYEREVPDLRERARVVRNPDPDRGPFSSLQCGLAAIDGGAADAGVFVLPVDVPAALPEVWMALAAAPPLQPHLHAAVPVHEGRGGHPVFLSGAFASTLRAAPAGSRLDAELAAALRERKVARIEVGDFRVRLNLNAPGDWAKLA
jgi:molybdenum cofactor cytidylyltransferase